MAIRVGDSVPDVTLAVMGHRGPEQVSTGDLFKGKKVVAFALPARFYPDMFGPASARFRGQRRCHQGEGRGLHPVPVRE